MTAVVDPNVLIPGFTKPGGNFGAFQNRLHAEKLPRRLEANRPHVAKPRQPSSPLKTRSSSGGPPHHARPSVSSARLTESRRPRPDACGSAPTSNGSVARRRDRRDSVSRAAPCIDPWNKLC